VLILQFAELTMDRIGARVFNIKFGDFKVVDGLDIFDKAGRNTAYEKYIEFELKDDEIFYQDHVCSNAYRFKDKKLVLEFEKTDRGSPKVDGIILFKGTLKETNYQDLKDVAEERKSEIELSKEAELDRRIGVKVTAKSDDYVIYSILRCFLILRSKKSTNQSKRKIILCSNFYSRDQALLCLSQYWFSY